MNIYSRILGVVVILSFVFFSLPIFADEPGIGNDETIYTSTVDKEIAKLENSSTAKSTFFRNGIEAKIARCERKSDLLSKKGKSQEAAAQKSRQESMFLEINKERLLRELVENNVPLKGYAVDYFLIRAYVNKSNGIANQYCCQ